MSLRRFWAINPKFLRKNKLAFIIKNKMGLPCSSSSDLCPHRYQTLGWEHSQGVSVESYLGYHRMSAANMATVVLRGICKQLFGHQAGLMQGPTCANIMVRMRLEENTQRARTKTAGEAEDKGLAIFNREDLTHTGTSEQRLEEAESRTAHGPLREEMPGRRTSQDEQPEARW